MPASKFFIASRKPEFLLISRSRLQMRSNCVPRCAARHVASRFSFSTPPPRSHTTDDSLSPYTSALSPSPCDSAGRGPQSALLLDLTSTNRELRDTGLSFRSRGVTKERGSRRDMTHYELAHVYSSSSTTCRVRRDHLSVPTIFDSGPLLKLGVVLPEHVQSFLALLRTFQNGWTTCTPARTCMQTPPRNTTHVCDPRRAPVHRRDPRQRDNFQARAACADIAPQHVFGLQE